MKIKIKKSHVSLGLLVLIVSLTIIGSQNQSVKPQDKYETPKTSAGEITIVTPENKTYTEPMSGYYPATFGFENDIISAPPQGLNSEVGPGTTIEVIGQLNDHKMITRLYDGASGTNNYANLSHTFSPKSSGVIEFWFRRSGVPEVVFIELWNETLYCLSIYSEDRGSGLAFEYYNGTDYIAIMSHNSDQWYHHRLDFNCTSGTFDWYIDGVLRGDDLLLRDPTPFFVRFTVRTRGWGSTGYNAYIDGLGMSWDINYNVGDNLNEGLLLSYENTTNLDWKGYLLDDQTNRTILGNTTIAMPNDGVHKIQVFGNDSVGTMYESNIRYFSVNTAPPEITFNSPSNSEVFGTSAPAYDISITGLYDTIWYTLDNGATNVTASGLTGTIDQSEWDKISDGIVTLIFYTNNSVGMGSAQVQVIKQISPGIPGYNLLALLGVTLAVTLILAKRKLQK